MSLFYYRRYNNRTAKHRLKTVDFNALDLTTTPVADPEFPKRGTANSKGGWKLHEIEKIGPRGVHVLIAR